MLRKNDPYRGQKIIASALLSGLSLIAFGITSNGEAFLSFLFLLFSTIKLIESWSGNPFKTFVSNISEHPK